MATCTVTGTVRDLQGVAIPNARVVFTRTGVTGQDSSVVIPKHVEATANGSGVISVVLYPGNYSALTITNGKAERFTVAVPEQTTANLADLIDSPAVPITPDMVLAALGYRNEAEGFRDEAEAIAASIDPSAFANRGTYATWAAVAAVTGAVPQAAEVLPTDAGTHTDPVVGGTVANAGIYIWSASPAGWKWMYASSIIATASSAEAIAGINATKAVTPAADKAALNSRFSGFQVVLLPPEHGDYVFGISAMTATGKRKLVAALDIDGVWTFFQLNLPAEAVTLASLSTQVAGQLLPTELTGKFAALAPESGWAAAFGTSGGKAVGFLGNGEVVGTIRQTAVRADNPDSTTSPMYGTLPLVIAGDSIAEGAGATVSANSWRVKLATALGVDHYNGGIGGQTAQQVATRFNSPSATVSAFTIPTSGAVAITPSVDLLYNSSALARSISASIGGVPGLVSRDTLGAYSFTRSTPGSAVGVLAGTPIITDPGSLYGERTAIFAIGTNDRGNSTGPDDLMTAAMALAAWHEPRTTRLFFIGPFNSSAEPTGSANHTRVLEMEARMSAIFGPMFINARRWLIDRGLALAGITPTTQDLADIANDIIPTSLRFDILHPNDTGQDLIFELVRDILLGRKVY